MRVLVVDDSAQMRRYARTILEAANLQVVEAENGRAALELLSTDAIQLVVTDLDMPEMNGTEFLKQLFKRDAPCPRTIVCSAKVNDGSEDVNVAPLSLCDGVLGKPYLPHELLSMVDQLPKRGD